MRREPLRPKPSPAIPASLPRDLLLHCMRKHDKKLAGALLSAPQPRWIRSRNEIRVTMYFDAGELS